MIYDKNDNKIAELPEAKRIYISGGITGVENWQDNFNRAEKELLELKGTFLVANPVTLSQNVEKQFARLNKTPGYADYMSYDIKVLCDCDTICMLPHWQRSNGAKLEYEIAKALDMTVLEFKLPKLKLPKQ